LWWVPSPPHRRTTAAWGRGAGRERWAEPCRWLRQHPGRVRLTAAACEGWREAQTEQSVIFLLLQKSSARGWGVLRLSGQFVLSSGDEQPGSPLMIRLLWLYGERWGQPGAPSGSAVPRACGAVAWPRWWLSPGSSHRRFSS